MRPRCALLIIGLLTACSSQVKDAEDRYAILEKSGRAEDLCAEGKRVVEAYLAAKDAEGYNRRKVETDITCMSRQYEERDGIYRMPDGTKQKIEADKL